jgi:tetratricopeptide (TPR) repeat protein
MTMVASERNDQAAPIRTDSWSMAESRQPPPSTPGVGFLRHDIPSESQLVLLSLDYLRDLRRAYANPQDLLEAEGLHSDWLTLAVYALNKSFANPASIANQNDAWKEAESRSSASSSVNVRKLPSIEAMTREICNKENPLGDDDEVEHERPYDKDLESYAWYNYDDSHPANAHRFYSLNGLASGPTGPLMLGDVAAAGLNQLQARSRLAAEQEMIASPLFEQFIETVKSKGFLDTGNDIPKDEPVEEEERILQKKQVFNERYQKAVAKFRSKLAAKAKTEDSNTTLSDHLYTRRMRRCLAVRKARNSKNNQTFPNIKSINSHLSKNIDRLGTKSPSESNPADLDEAERLKSLGNAYMQKKEYKAACSSYTQALKLSPSGPFSHVYFSNRAAALMSMKKFGDAIMDSERALALKPTYAKAHARLGLAHFLIGDYRQSMEAYTVALKYEPSNKSSRSYLEKAARRLANDGDNLTQASNNGPIGSSFSVVSEWDKPSKSTGQGGFAAGVLSTERNLHDQKDAEKFKIRGNTLMASRNYSKAFDAYSAAIQLSRDGPQSHVYFANRSAALCYLEQYSDAAKDAEQSVRLRPTYGKAYARLGLSRFFLDEFEGAVKAYKAALEFDPDNAASRSYLAKAQLKLEKQREEAQPKVSTDARRLLNDPDMMLMAKKAMDGTNSKALLEDPEMLTIAKKAVSDPTMMDAMMAAQNLHKP